MASGLERQRRTWQTRVKPIQDKAMSLEAPEVEIVTKAQVSCDGGGEHPRVWLTIPEDKGWVECGYCDKRFELKKD